MNGFADGGLDEVNFGETSSGIISGFDAFPKTKRTYQTGTHNGGLWTILLAIFCLWLTSTEFWRWMEGTTTNYFSVEKGVAHDLQINMDVVIPMQCEDLHVNVQDASGDIVLAGEMLSKDPTQWEVWMSGMLQDNAGRKSRVGELGVPWYFRSEATEYKKQEDVHTYLSMAKHKRHWAKTPKLSKRQVADACRIYGSVESTKVQGDFHITARGHGYGTNMQHLDHSRFNFSHHINELSFGPFFPSINQPLDNAQSTTDHNFYKYQYFISVVPTIYTDSPHQLVSSTPPSKNVRRQRKPYRDMTPAEQREYRRKSGSPLKRMAQAVSASEPGSKQHQAGASIFSSFFGLFPHTVYTNQYAVTEQSHPVEEQAVPGLFFKYDIEPILLTVTEEWGGMLGLLVRCVTVVAGVLVAGGWIVALCGWAGEMWGRRRGRATSVGGLLYGATAEKSSLD